MGQVIVLGTPPSFGSCAEESHVSFHELHYLRDTVSPLPSLGFDAGRDGLEPGRCTYEAAQAPDIYRWTPGSTEDYLWSSQMFGLDIVAQVFVGP